MAKTKIPKSVRKGLKRAIKNDGGSLSESSIKGKNKTKKSIRSSIEDGDMKRTKITWAVSVGDLVRVRTKHLGEKLGVVVEVDKDGVRVTPQAHPRDIVALPQDVKVLVSV